MDGGFRIWLITLLSTGIAGCQQKIADPVVVTVNGKQITQAEIDADLSATPGPPGAGRQVLRRMAAQRVIDRELIAAAAKASGLDKCSDFLIQKQRVDDLLLDRYFAEQQLQTLPLPSDDQIRQYISAHPSLYGRREQLILDQIRFPTPKDPNIIRLFAQDHDFLSIIARLKSLGIDYQRNMVGLDTASLPQQVVDQIDKVAANEPFLLPQSGMVTMNVITRRNRIETDPAAIRQAAAGAWRQEALAKLVNTKLSVLKADAHINYEPHSEYLTLLK